MNVWYLYVWCKSCTNRVRWGGNHSYLEFIGSLVLLSLTVLCFVRIRYVINKVHILTLAYQTFKIFQKKGMKVLCDSWITKLWLSNKCSNQMYPIKYSLKLCLHWLSCVCVIEFITKQTWNYLFYNSELNFISIHFLISLHNIIGTRLCKFSGFAPKPPIRQAKYTTCNN